MEFLTNKVKRCNPDVFSPTNPARAKTTDTKYEWYKQKPIINGIMMTNAFEKSINTRARLASYAPLARYSKPEITLSLTNAFEKSINTRARLASYAPLARYSKPEITLSS
jgi:hypothetical protein